MTPNSDTGAPGASGPGRAILGGATRLGAVALRPAAGAFSFGLKGAQRGALTALDTLLASRFAGDAVDRVLASPLPERAMSRALDGPLVEAVARDLVRLRVLERVADRLLEEPAMERLAARVIDSRLLDEVVVRLLESEELWLLVDEIAHSPAVTDAITSQSASFADEIAGRVRASSRSADAWLETRARRALRRRSQPDAPPDGFNGR